ncbi:hypothetical protein M5361_00705 [Ligilactobacillus agilis]|nr:hypothetical protein [Ligilactobacillus agilis]
MQIYILNRARETLATTASIYNDKHTLTLEAGSSSYEFTIDKNDEASHYLDSGNYIVLQDDKGKTWLFTILDYEETHNTKTVYAEDAGIELINKAVDIWKGDGPHPFSYYFDLVTKGTPWKLGVNQLAGLSRTLTYEGRDTGLGRLLSILKGFDNAECTFDVTVKMNAPAEFKINVYKQVGNDRSDVQIVYNNELNNITKKESRAEFVTALAGVGGQIQTEDGSEGGNVDFSELEYDKDGFVTKKGDKFLRAVDANRTFNPGQESYIESFYEYDTQSPSELLNRTLSKLKTYSEPQYTYTADVKVIDSSLVLGDTVTILDHDYNPALYLSARVAKLVKSYTDPAQNEIEFTNYRLLNSALADKLARLQVIVNTLPSASRVSAIETNLIKLTKQQEEVIVKVESANGKNTNYYGGSQPENAKQGDSWFYTDEEGNQGIKQYQNGVWVDVISSKFGPKLEADIKQTQDDMQGLSDEVEEARSKAQEAFAKTVDNATNVQNVIRDVAQAHADLEKAKQSLQTTSQGLDQARQDLLSNSTRLDKLEVGVNGVTVNVNNLNTKVDNIKIGGTNLLRKTSNEWKTWTGTGWANNTVDAGPINLEPGTYTFRAEIDNTGNTQRGVHTEAYVDSEKKFLDQIAKSYTQTFVNAGSKGYVTITFTIDRPLTDVRIHPHAAKDSPIPSTVTVKWRREKLEKGNVATDWSPAPEDEIERVSQLRVDLDGLSGTVANNKGDIAQIKLTENGMQQNIRDAQGNISSLQNDAKGFKQQFADTNGNITAIKRNATELSEQLASKVGNIEYQNFKAQTAKELSQKLVRTDLNGYATTTEVKLTADGLKEQYTQLNGKIDGLGGGKNLARGTSNSWQGVGTTEFSGTTNFTKHVADVYLDDLSVGDKVTVQIIYQYSGLTATNATCWLQGSGDVTGWTGGTFYGSPALVRMQTGTDLKSGSAKYTFTIDSTMKKNRYWYVSYRFDNVNRGTWFQWLKFKVEKGEVATPWTPALEDVSTEIAKTNETIKTVDENVTTVKNNLDKTKSVVTQLANLFDVTVGDSSISVTNGGVLVKGKRIHIDGQTLIDNGVIQGAKIADASIETAKIADAAITSAKIANLDVNKLSGNKSTFVQSVWNGISNSVNITPTGLESASGSNQTTITGGRIETNSLWAKDYITVGRHESDPRQRWGIDIDRKGMWFGVPVKKNGAVGNNAGDYSYEIQGAIKGYGWDYSRTTINGNGSSGIMIGLAEQGMWGGNYGGDFIGIGRFVKNEYQNLDSAQHDFALTYNATSQGFAVPSNTVHIWKDTYIHGNTFLAYGAGNGMYRENAGIRTAWVSWSDWDNGARHACLVNSNNNWGGVAFPFNGNPALFSVNGERLSVFRSTGTKYNDYGGWDVVSSTGKHK